MAIDFFEAQQQARKKTGRLVFLFGLAVAMIIGLIYLVVVLLFRGGTAYANAKSGANATSMMDGHIWDSQLFAIIAGAVIIFVGGACLLKISQLAAGGKVVAESLGGILIHHDSTDTTERKILNVVEEMAIASGMSVPPVYLLEEKSINAFAAGLKPEDAVIGVTRGCVERLSRDELQGVMAHEFSHILNGDMRMNIKLIGVLAGIMAIGIGGYYLMRIAFYSGVVGRRSKDNNPFAIAALGLALMIIGFVGVFFGNLIKAAISRQREYLADASAVQFTRNPDGISGALIKIGGLALGSKLASANASEASHMYFGQGVPNYMGFLWATHPPLEQRIKAIDPGWDGQFLEPKQYSKQKRSSKQNQQAKRQQFGQMITTGILVGAGASESATATSNKLGAQEFVDQIGTLTEQHVEHARNLIALIPDNLKDAARGSYGARAIVYALLIDTHQQVRDKQLSRLRSHADNAVTELTEKILADVDAIDSATRLPLLDIAIGSLKELSSTQYKMFKENVHNLVGADQKVDLFEFMIGKMIERHLTPQFEKVTRRRAYHYSLRAVANELAVLLSTLAYVGHDDKSQAKQAFADAAGDLYGKNFQLLSTQQCDLQTLSDALDKLNLSGPRQKKEIIGKCVTCVASDGVVTLREAELLRAVADSMQCPAPPMLAGQGIQ